MFCIRIPLSWWLLPCSQRKGGLRLMYKHTLRIPWQFIKKVVTMAPKSPSTALHIYILHWAKFPVTKWTKGSRWYFYICLSENINLTALWNADWQQSDWWACITKASWSWRVAAHTAWASLLLDERARTALGNRPGLTASADSAASVQGWLFVGGTKSGYYFKRNSHRKNVGFKTNKWAHGSWVKL